MASRSVVRQLGDKLKSAVRYAFRYDAFEERLFPRRGWGVSSTSELAGVGVDPNMLRFFRQRLAAQVAVPLSATASLSLTAEAGALLPWGAGGSAARPSSLSDRFFPGGLNATPLRGFRQKGVGPSDVRRPDEAASAAPLGRDGDVSRSEAEASGPSPGRDALGGDFFGTILASLSFELPFELAREAGMHGHVFLNGGSVVGVAGREGGLRDRAREFGQSLRWTVVRFGRGSASDCLELPLMAMLRAKLLVTTAHTCGHPRWSSLSCAGGWHRLADARRSPGAERLPSSRQARARPREKRTPVRVCSPGLLITCSLQTHRHCYSFKGRKARGAHGLGFPPSPGTAVSDHRCTR